jgi:O-antigen/teichoic acid export membrane protein
MSADIGRRARSGLAWNVLGTIVTNATRVAVLAVLGRTIDSAEFGIVAVAVAVNVILYSIRDLGIATALVQRSHITDGHLATAFATTTYAGIIIAGALFGSAPLIADVMGIPAATDVIRALGSLFVLLGISAASRAQAVRAMRFRAIAIIDTVSYMAGAATSITAALLGLGVGALVLGYLVEELMTSTLYLVLSPPKYSLRVERRYLSELMTVGTGQMIIQVAGIVATYADNFIVGRGLGERMLGYYTRAYDLIKYPSILFGNMVGLVLSPAFARMQHDRERLATNFRRLTFLNALAILPASAALAILAPEAIRLLLGPNWEPAVLPFQVLAFTMLLRITQKLGAILGTAAGAVNAVARAYVVYAVLVIVGASSAVSWGIVGVAASTALALLVVSVDCTYIAMRVSGLRARDVLAAHAPGLVLAALTAAIVWPAAVAMRAHALPTAAVFVALALASILACLALLAVWLRRGRGDFAWLGKELRRVLRRRATASAS